MACAGLVALGACGEQVAQSQVEPSTTVPAPSTSTTAATAVPTLVDAKFGAHTVKVPAGWSVTSDVGDLGARAIWSDPANPRYQVIVTSGPGTNYWNHELGRWRGDLPGFPEADAKRVTPKYLQYQPMVVDDLATTRALMVNRNAAQWVEISTEFPIAWQPQADQIMSGFADCVTGRSSCS